MPLFSQIAKFVYLNWVISNAYTADNSLYINQITHPNMTKNENKTDI